MRVGVFLAQGFEEVEALTVVDLLRRSGMQVKSISIHESTMVEGAHGIKVEADNLFEEINDDDFDGIVLPGGMPGTLHLQEHAGVCEIVRKFFTKKKLIAAICAAPTVFGHLGLLQGKKATCYPNMEEGLTGASVCYEPVVVDENVITSRGVGTAIDFSAAIIQYLMDEKTAQSISQQIVYKQ